MKNKKRKISQLSATDCFPKNKKIKNIFSERAKLMASQSNNQIKQDETSSYINFYLGDTEKYGIDYQYIKEVINNVALTRIPCTLPCIAGIINKRGALLTVLDLKQFLFNQPIVHETFNIIISYADNMTFGILVDTIIGNKNYNKNSLDNAFPSENIDKTDYILGLHEGRIAILNVPMIISTLVSKLSRTVVS